MLSRGPRRQCVDRRCVRPEKRRSERRVQDAGARLWRFGTMRFGLHVPPPPSCRLVRPSKYRTVVMLLATPITCLRIRVALQKQPAPSSTRRPGHRASGPEREDGLGLHCPGQRTEFRANNVSSGSRSTAWCAGSSRDDRQARSCTVPKPRPMVAQPLSYRCLQALRLMCARQEHRRSNRVWQAAPRAHWQARGLTECVGRS